MGRAKLTPLLRPVPCRVKVAVLMPIRRPLLSSSAPPELPALMDASVCRPARSCQKQAVQPASMACQHRLS